MTSTISTRADSAATVLKTKASQKQHSFRSPNTLMVQGTTSDAGKSIVVTALCRILARNKFSVAPFKPQNMALNSAVTVEGGEIGRAQAVQADACYLPASIKMNPVLLKPNSDLGAQVIVHGQAIGNMQAQEYHQYKPELLKTVTSTHAELQSRYQLVIVEGAGSPAEINLRAHDIANMGFAEAIDCPVIIVADIDRGGVFAHLYGTYALLSETEKQRVQGFVINRFRGDVALLESGLEWLQTKTGVPTLAVIPYINDLHIEAEDSLARQQQCSVQQPDVIGYHRCKVVVLMYPRASNHTDFDVLRMHSDIDCQFEKDSSQFTGADIIVLPGSKNIRGDLQWLKDNGWEAIINRHLRLGGKVIGICGGYQMLGKWVHDPDEIESSAGSTQGLGLLDMETTLTLKKMLRNVKGTFIKEICIKEACIKRDCIKGDRIDKSKKKITVKGYEIHAGQSYGASLDQPLLQLQYADNAEANNNQMFTDGAVSCDDKVMGTYVHGFFDQADALEYCLQWGRPDLGVTKNTIDYDYYKNAEIDRLADEVEKVFPLDKILPLLHVSQG